MSTEMNDMATAFMGNWGNRAVWKIVAMYYVHQSNFTNRVICQSGLKDGGITQPTLNLCR